MSPGIETTNPAAEDPHKEEDGSEAEPEEQAEEKEENQKDTLALEVADCLTYPSSCAFCAFISSLARILPST